MVNSNTSGITVTAVEKRKIALELRKEGYTFEEIGARLGCVKSTAFKHVAKGLSELTEKMKHSADELRELENARLDNLWMHAYAEVELGDLAAINTCLRISERRSKLNGLDSPTRTDITLTPQPPQLPVTEKEKQVLNELARIRGGLQDDE